MIDFGVEEGTDKVIDVAAEAAGIIAAAGFCDMEENDEVISPGEVGQGLSCSREERPTLVVRAQFAQAAGAGFSAALDFGDGAFVGHVHCVKDDVRPDAFAASSM
jgi:hypothetical protein